MTIIPEAINLPEPQNQREADLFNSIRDYLYQVLDAITKTEDDLSGTAAKEHTQNTDTSLGAQSENLDMNTHKVVSVVDPTSDQDAATKVYVDDLIEAGLIPVIAVSTTTKTLALSDVNSVQSCTHASGCTITVPPNASVAFEVGTQISIIQSAATQVTVSPGSGVTVSSRVGYTKTNGQHTTATLVKLATNSWILTGNLGS